MKIKSYYWAIIAAAGLVLVVLASMGISRFIASDSDNGQSPHSDADYNRMLSDIDYTPQIEAYQDLIAANPDDYLARAGLGELYFGLERYDEAVPQLESAMGLNPAEPKNYGYLGAAYLELNRTGDAEAVLTKGLAMAPANQSLLLETGYLYLLSGDSGRARSLWQQARDVDPASRLGVEAEKMLTELDQQTQTSTAPTN